MKFNWFKRKASSGIAINSLWTPKQRDPFKRTKTHQIKVLAVKEGWVQLEIAPGLPDQTMKIDSFLLAYEPKR